MSNLTNRRLQRGSWLVPVKFMLSCCHSTSYKLALQTYLTCQQLGYSLHSAELIHYCSS